MPLRVVFKVQGIKRWMYAASSTLSGRPYVALVDGGRRIVQGHAEEVVLTYDDNLDFGLHRMIGYK